MKEREISVEQGEKGFKSIKDILANGKNHDFQTTPSF